MKKTLLLIAFLALTALVVSPILAEEAPAEVELPEAAPVAPDQAPDPTAKSIVCQASVSYCPAGAPSCAGKHPGDSCAGGGTCYEACDRIDEGTVCECWSFSSAGADLEIGDLEGADAAAFLAQFAPTCKDDTSKIAD